MGQILSVLTVVFKSDEEMYTWMANDQKRLQRHQGAVAMRWALLGAFLGALGGASSLRANYGSELTSTVLIFGSFSASFVASLFGGMISTVPNAIPFLAMAASGCAVGWGGASALTNVDWTKVFRSAS